MKVKRTNLRYIKVHAKLLVVIPLAPHQVCAEMEYMGIGSIKSVKNEPCDPMLTVIVQIDI